MKQQDFFIVWSKLHGDAKVAGIVKAWLIISFALVKPLSKLKFTPNILTLLWLILWSITLYKCSITLGCTFISFITYL